MSARIGWRTAGLPVGALALGVGACGGDDRRRGAAEGGGKTLTIYSSMPLQGASSPQTKAIVNGMELALEQAGNKAGEHTIKYVSLDNSTAQAGTVDAGGDDGERPQGRAGRHDSRLHRRVQLRRRGGLDPDPQRGRGAPDQSGEHRRRPDRGRAGGHRGRARQVLPDGAADLRAHRHQGLDPGPGPAVGDGGGRLHQGGDDQRQGGLRRRARGGHRGRGGRLRARGHLQRRDRQELRQLPLTGPERRVGGRRLLHLLGDHREQRGPALQGLRGGAPRREALRAGRRLRERIHRPQEGGVPTDVASRFQCTSPSLPPSELPPDGQDVLHGLRREVRRQDSRSVLDLRLRGDAPGARRDRALGDRARRKTSSRRCSTPRTARACSARTRSTTTATRR